MKLGIVGVGMIFDFHLKGFRSVNDAEIIGACRDFYGDDEMQAKQRTYFEVLCKDKNLKSYLNYDEMVADSEIEAVIITSVNPYHYDHIMKALDNNKHVLAEKPVVTEFEHLKSIEMRVEEQNCIVFPGHNYIYRNAVLKAKQVLDSGRLGKITYAQFISTHTLSEEHIQGWRSKKEIARGGALLDSGHHQTYLSLFMFGMPQKIHAFKSNLVLRNMECEDIAQINLLYPNGMIGTIMQSWTSNFGDGINGIKIVGDKGHLEVTDALYVNNEKIDDDADYTNSFANQALAFYNTVVNGNEPLSTLKDVHDSLRIIYGAYESAENDRVIQL